MTSLDVAWPKRMQQAAVPPPAMPPPNQTPIAHPTHALPVMRIANPHEEVFAQIPHRLEGFVQDSMSTLNRSLEALKEDIKRQNDRDERFEKLERLIKRATMAILAAIALCALLSWFRAERVVKQITNSISKLAASRLSVEQVLNLVS